MVPAAMKNYITWLVSSKQNLAFWNTSARASVLILEAQSKVDSACDLTQGFQHNFSPYLLFPPALALVGRFNPKHSGIKDIPT